MDARNLVFNGINGTTGEYLLPEMTPQKLARVALGESWDDWELSELKWWYHRTAEATFGPEWLVDRIRVQQQYLIGSESLDQAMADMQRYTDAAADRMIKQFKLKV